MPPCINTTVEGKGTRVKKRRGRRGKEKRKKEREKDKPALPIRCLPIKRVAAIDFEGGAHPRATRFSLRHVLQEQKERSGHVARIPMHMD